MKSQSLTYIIPWAHQMLAEPLEEGDLAVDLTAGNGHDTLFLARCVGPEGKVIAFDVQRQALAATADRLTQASVPFCVLPSGDEAGLEAGVTLVHDCHTRLATYLPEAPKAIIANLGYLPGGDRSLITRSESTLTVLDQAFSLLAPGGRIAVGVYVGHPGGAEEGEAVARLFAALPEKGWQVLRLESLNRPEAPFLLVAQRR